MPPGVAQISACILVANRRMSMRAFGMCSCETLVGDISDCARGRWSMPAGRGLVAFWERNWGAGGIQRCGWSREVTSYCRVGELQRVVSGKSVSVLVEFGGRTLFNIQNPLGKIQ